MAKEVETRVNKALITVDGGKLIADPEGLAKAAVDDSYDRVEALRAARAEGVEVGEVTSADTSYDRVEELRSLRGAAEDTSYDRIEALREERLEELHAHDTDTGDITTNLHHGE